MVPWHALIAEPLLRGLAANPTRESLNMQLEKKSFGSPDEVRPMADKGRVELVKVGDGVVGKATFEPGWRWSEHVKPIAGTESCQAAHVGYVLSGHQKVLMDDGTELDLGPGDVVAIPPGHDGWVVGNEPSVVLDFAGMEHYAESR
jgi:quercetin dioxygenase-like cupin family protein